MGSWRGSCREASAAWPWCSCTPTRECGPLGRGPGWPAVGGGGGRRLRGPGRHRRWAQHEQQVGTLARELGFAHVSLSSETMPMVRIVPRGHTACADAYLTPTIQRYVQGFRRGFQGQLKVRRPCPLLPATLPGPALPLTAHLPIGRAGALHALRRRPGARGLLQRLPRCALWPCRGCGWLRSHHLQGGGRPPCHWL